MSNPFNPFQTRSALRFPPGAQSYSLSSTTYQSIAKQPNANTPTWKSVLFVFDFS